MEEIKTYKCRVDEHLSPANKINNDRRIIQQDVCIAKGVLNEQNRPGSPFNGSMSQISNEQWESRQKAYDMMCRAYKHQPGEKGARTVGKGDIVSRD